MDKVIITITTATPKIWDLQNLLKNASSKIDEIFSLNSIYIIGRNKTPFYRDPTHVGGTKKIHSQKLYFDPDDVISGQFAQKHIFQNGQKKFSQLDIYHRV